MMTKFIASFLLRAIGSAAGVLGSAMALTQAAAALPTQLYSAHSGAHGRAACDGVTDDSLQMQDAVTAARNNAFNLVIDCHTFVHIYQDITRPIFVDNNTTISFSDGGQIIIDNSNVPGFVFANVTNITLTNWVVLYHTTANAITPANMSLPLVQKNVGYYDNGTLMGVGSQAPASAFNATTMTNWLHANRGITFTGERSYWVGPLGESAILYFTGATTNVTITNISMSVPANVPGSAYIPLAIGFYPQWNTGSTVTSSTTTSPTVATNPSHVTVNGLTLDGFIMGLNGSASNSSFSNLTFGRFADMQDSTTTMFTGTILGKTLIVTGLSSYGAITVGQTLFDTTGKIPQGSAGSGNSTTCNLGLQGIVGGILQGIVGGVLPGTPDCGGTNAGNLVITGGRALAWTVAATDRINSWSINSGGSGFVTGDKIVVPATIGVSALGTVTATNGKVTAITWISQGSFASTANPSNPVKPIVASGVGSGLSVTLIMSTPPAVPNILAETMSSAFVQNIGGNSPGIGAICGMDSNSCWTPPPHAIYMGSSQDASGFMQNTTFTNIVDNGPRFGIAPRNVFSGNLMAYKIGGGPNLKMTGTNSATRPDGCFDFTSANNGFTVTNLTCHYNSYYDYNRYPGIRFAGYSFTNYNLSGITIYDANFRTLVNPVGNIVNANNFSMTASSHMVAWGGGGTLPPQPAFTGTKTPPATVAITYCTGC